MAELNPNAELLDLTTKKTTQKIVYNIRTSLLMVVIILRSTNQIKKIIIKGNLNTLTFWLGKIENFKINKRTSKKIKTKKN